MSVIPEGEFEPQVIKKYQIEYTFQKIIIGVYRPHRLSETGDCYSPSSVKVNNSSTVTANTFVISIASFKEGLYLPFSR